ncbi:MAG TPA: lytic transglycosylase domain-containing protein, partial [Burkholderiales bacterium]|nr:lytic transglycosylase domain-containing protein [Burkholderiales bacterium]
MDRIPVGNIASQGVGAAVRQDAPVPLTAADVAQIANEEGLDPRLALAVYQQESSSGANAKTSSKGARGGFQVMPATFAQMMPGGNIDDPADNARAGIRYLKTNFDRYGGDVDKTVAAYFTGPGNVDKAGGIPLTSDGATSTPQYVAGVRAKLDKQGGGPVQNGAAKNVPTWDEVRNLPDMQGLNSEQLEQARNQYFLDVVAPQVPTDQLKAARTAFDSDTAPGAINRAMRAFGDALQAVKSGSAADLARRGVAAVDSALKQPRPGEDDGTGGKVPMPDEGKPFDRLFGERVRGYMAQGLDSAAADEAARRDIAARRDNSQPLRGIATDSTTKFGRELRAGWAGMGTTLDGIQMSDLAGILEAKRRNSTPEQLAEDKEYQEGVQGYQRLRDQIEQRARAVAALPRSSAVKKMFDGEGAEGVDNFVSAWKQDPVGAAAVTVGGSVPGSLAMLAAATLARFGGLGVGGAVAAGGAASVATEFGGDYAENRAAGMDHDEAWNRAAAKAGVVGLFDAVSLHSAGH